MARQILKGKKITWHHFSKLEESDFEILRTEFKFHPLDFDDLRDPNELPKLDIYKYYLFAILSVPTLNAEDRVNKSDLAIFIGADYVVTITREPIEAVDRFFARAKRSVSLKREIFGKSTGYFVYKLLDYIFRDAKVILHQLTREAKQIEKEVYYHHSKETTRRLSLLRRDVLYLRHIIDPQRILITQFISSGKSFVGKTLDVYYDDLRDTLNSMWVIADNLKVLIDGLFDVNETFLSHRTNEIIRILTIISVILMPPTLITSYYGMNIAKLPFAHSIELVSLMIIISVLASWILILYIDRRK
ncbi:hypothetical protein D6827_01350 [Candidatus Parcubacteria bacterium]|nr:MAG: hypothetical protein D6827_01350 [Candidatus Parcubacteria bacterium]